MHTHSQRRAQKQPPHSLCTWVPLLMHDTNHLIMKKRTFLSVIVNYWICLKRPWHKRNLFGRILTYSNCKSHLKKRLHNSLGFFVINFEEIWICKKYKELAINMKTHQSPTKHALYWLLQHISLMIFFSNQALTKLGLKHKTIKSNTIY